MGWEKDKVCLSLAIHLRAVERRLTQWFTPPGTLTIRSLVYYAILETAHDPLLPMAWSGPIRALMNSP
jgi:hypothetical protein